MSYLPHTARERKEMLDVIGVESVDDLFANIPPGLRSGAPHLPSGLSELEVVRLLDELASQNQDVDHRPCFLGAGAYHHYVPAVVGSITGRSEFSTAYTPYQAEVSQGTLQVIYEYQTMIAELTGLDVSNASLYDAATAVAEASTVAINQTRRNRIAIAQGVHPEYRQVLRTYMHGQGFELIEIGEAWTCDPAVFVEQLDNSIAGLIVQSPNFWGAIEPMSRLSDIAHATGSLLISVNNPISLAMLSSPAEFGADLAVGCGQPLGIPLQFGGPYLGFIAARSELLRRLPGRIAGATVDNQGRKGYVLTLQAREQHIRREKATSNICTNHALMALAATVYVSLLGNTGLREVAQLCFAKAHYTAQRIAEIPGFSMAFDAPFFNEFAVQCPVPATEVNRFLLNRGIIGGYDLGRDDPAMPHHLLLALTELNTRQEIDDLVSTLSELQPQVQAAGESPALQGAGTGGAS